MLCSILPPSFPFVEFFPISTPQAEIAGLKSKLQEVMGERDKLKAIDRSPSGAGTPRSTTSNPAR
jgi:hypothetical protein